MTTKAFILVEAEHQRTEAVTNALRKLSGVKSVNPVTGPYDIISVIEGESLNDIGDLVTRKIHSIAGVHRTVTCLALVEPRRV